MILNQISIIAVIHCYSLANLMISVQDFWVNAVIKLW